MAGIVDAADVEQARAHIAKIAEALALAVQAGELGWLAVFREAAQEWIDEVDDVTPSLSAEDRAAGRLGEPALDFAPDIEDDVIAELGKTASTNAFPVEALSQLLATRVDMLMTGRPEQSNAYGSYESKIRRALETRVGPKRRGDAKTIIRCAFNACGLDARNLFARDAMKSWRANTSNSAKRKKRGTNS